MINRRNLFLVALVAFGLGYGIAKSGRTAEASPSDAPAQARSIDQDQYDYMAQQPRHWRDVMVRN